MHNHMTQSSFYMCVNVFITQFDKDVFAILFDKDVIDKKNKLCKYIFLLN